MATTAFSGVLWQVRRAAARAEGTARSDGELLERFRTERDEDAFAALVDRHGPMVFGVCRRTLGNVADAEDAFQATFLVLARKADAVQPSGRVGHWLYGVAFNTARKARVMNRRRLDRERRSGEQRLPREPGDDAFQVREALDLELQRLPEVFREAVVLCDLEGEPLNEAARRLNCPLGTVASRLARARELLRRNLARRGLALSALLVPGIAAASVPSRLAMATTEAAAGMSSIPTHVLALTEGVLRAMFLSKVKFAFAAIIAAGVLVAGIGNGTNPVFADPDKPVKPGADPVKPGADPVKPVKPGADPVKPVKPGADPVKPVKPGADPAKPVKPGEKPGKPEGVKTPVANGTIKGVDAGKGTITVSTPTKGGNVKEATYPLEKDARVYLDGKEAKLEDLKIGYQVGVKLTADGTKAVGVGAEGPTLTGELKALDAAKHTVQVKVTTYPDPTDKTKTGSEDKSLKLADDVKVMVEGQKKATLEDLKTGASVAVRISADGERVIAISSPAKRASDGVKKPEKPGTDPKKPTKPVKPGTEKPTKPGTEKPTKPDPVKP